MKKAIIILISLFLISCSKTKSKDHALICKGYYSRAYHKDYKNPSYRCTGLKACKANIERVPITEAEKQRHPCHYCW